MRINVQVADLAREKNSATVAVLCVWRPGAVDKLARLHSQGQIIRSGIAACGNQLQPVMPRVRASAMQAVVMVPSRTCFSVSSAENLAWTVNCQLGL